MTKIIFATLLAAFATVAQAVKLTNSDWNVVAGEAFTIGWTGAEGGVSIRLKSGPANSLQTVQEIAGGLSGESFTWTVPTNLDSAQYAIEIEDGSGSHNYSVQFPISGDGSGSNQTESSEEAATTTPVATLSTSADISPASTSATGEVQKTESEKETTGSSADPTTQHEAFASTASTLTTTGANRPSSTESDTAKSDTAESEIPNSGTAGHSGSALMGAVVGALLLACY